MIVKAGFETTKHEFPVSVSRFGYTSPAKKKYE